MVSISRQVLASLCAAAALALPAFAQVPAGSMTQLVVPYPAGGPTDAIARAISPAMSKALHRTVIVQNTAGASGALAAQKVLDAPPDGQLVLVGDPNGTVLAPLALSAVRFKPEDFVMVRNLGTSPFALVGRATLASTLDELVAARPKGLTFGSSGIGSLNHLAGEDFRARTGLDMVHVPYPGDLGG
jgi:tripartite-type tricarboxylate transporter receptor subunit TctC